MPDTPTTAKRSDRPDSTANPSFTRRGKGALDATHWWLLALFAVAIVVYWRALAGEFVWDDRTYFVDNDILPHLEPWNLGRILLEPGNDWNSHLPFLNLLFVLERWIFGSFIAGYHAVSLLLYGATAIVAYRLIRLLFGASSLGQLAEPRGSAATRLGALFAIAIFVLHPVHVEAVAYIVGQADLLYSLFSLLAIYLLCMTYLRGERKMTAKRLALIVGLYYCAILSKHSGIATGLVIPGLWLVFLRRQQGDARLRGLAIALAVWGAANVPVFLWIRHNLELMKASGAMASVDIDFVQRIGRGLRILGEHTKLTLYPRTLSFGYPFDAAWQLDLAFALGVAVVIAGLVAVWRAPRTMWAFGAILFLGFLFPNTRLVGSEMSNAIIYDRYLFLPILGLGLCAGYLAAKVAVRGEQRRHAIAALAAGISLALGALTFAYVPTFRDNVASLGHSHRAFPAWNRAAFEYVYVLIEARRLDEAEQLTEKEPTFAKPAWVRNYFRGAIAVERGEHDRAIPLLTQASMQCQAGGYFPFPNIWLGKALIAKNQLPMAERVLAIALSYPYGSFPLQKREARTLLQEIAFRRQSVN